MIEKSEGKQKIKNRKAKLNARNPFLFIVLDVAANARKLSLNVHKDISLHFDEVLENSVLACA